MTFVDILKQREKFGQLFFRMMIFHDKKSISSQQKTECANETPMVLGFQKNKYSLDIVERLPRDTKLSAASN